MVKNAILYGTSVFFLFFASNSQSSEGADSDFFGANSRWSIDAATRVTHNQDKDSSSFMHVIGFDLHKIFSHKTYDIGTLTLQPYLVKLSNVANPPLNFDDGNDTQLTWRIANFNYTGLSQGKFNIKAGHFEIPFGLEYQLDTNGTLRQITSDDRGIKADWGVSVNGILPNVEYEISLTRGSGSEIKSRGNPHVFAGRIGSSSHKNFVTGLSWFTGDVLGKQGVTEHNKVALDISYYYYQWQFMLESSAGKEAGNSTTNSFAELIWNNATEKFSTYLQLGYNNAEINHEVNNKKSSTSYWLTGVQWLGGNGFDVSAQYKHKLNNSPVIDSILTVQLRYRM
ncbi:hypothetical protein EKO29_10290 [Colwellia sp. Arc7-635]|uniref:hypothetical protein n=1 Tax=Colwellia sp. Arc7-635 TaxID=2497879 RepID=UPI000F8520CF|nr:hypothetical protein [Colwellia sp. Arc7-635]AZQ84372.1 hypothetical protein EKO29_10290 [Colwellia sp. Arc7-635]